MHENYISEILFLSKIDKTAKSLILENFRLYGTFIRASFRGGGQGGTHPLLEAVPTSSYATRRKLGPITEGLR